MALKKNPPIPWHFQALLSCSPNAQLAPFGIPASYHACPFGPFWIAYSRDLSLVQARVIPTHDRVVAALPGQIEIHVYNIVPIRRGLHPPHYTNKPPNPTSMLVHITYNVSVIGSKDMTTLWSLVMSEYIRGSLKTHKYR